MSDRYRIMQLDFESSEAIRKAKISNQKKMSENIYIEKETLKMLISVAHQEGYKLAHQTLSNLDVNTLSNKLADKLVKSLKPKEDETIY